MFPTIAHTPVLCFDRHACSFTCTQTPQIAACNRPARGYLHRPMSHMSKICGTS